MRVPISAASLALTLTVYANSAGAEPLCHAKVAIRADKLIAIDGQTFSDEKALDAYVSKLHSENSHCAMSVTVDKDASIGSLAELIAAMRKAGFEKIGFLTEPQNLSSH
jgi:biopolymer transport protein ExbD